MVSFAAQFASQKIASTCRDYKFSTNLVNKKLEAGSFDPTLIKKFKEKGQLNKVLDMIRMADIGIETIDYSEFEKVKLIESLEKLESYQEKTIKNVQKQVKFLQDFRNDFVRIIRDQAIFKHKIDNHLKNFTPDLESDGTLQFLIILSEVIDALENGNVVILDKIELKLHQNLVAYIIGLFQNPSENKHRGQLIFSFHNTFFMEILTPEQLWFTEKNDQGYTELFSAVAFEGDIKELYQQDLEMLYRVGRFGAKPREL
jgi:hypothetical protein